MSGILNAPALNPLRRVFSRTVVVNTIGIRLC
nr:MAG TPA: hypothetical protein [Caudoviricetes sp.]DAP81832.1 MAG TPA: hypothetical protein [Caudoviricetes sp.]